MRSIQIFFSLLTFMHLSVATAQDKNILSLKDLEGTWYVNMSNFPMWLDGKRKNPRITYTLQSDGKILDVVAFEKKGKTKTIKGYDERSTEIKSGFVWRGKGLKAIFTSEWKVLFYHQKYELAVLAFEKTLFTPAGFDVISRKKKIPPTALEFIQAKLPLLGVKPELTVIKQQ